MDELAVLDKKLQEHKITQREYSELREEIYNRDDFATSAINPDVKQLVDQFIYLIENPSEITMPHFISFLLENFLQIGQWKNGSIHERVATRTYLWKTGALKHIISIYAKEKCTCPDYPEVAAIETELAGHCCWTFLETDRDRKVAHRCGLSDVILSNIVDKDDPEMVGAYWALLEYEECREFSTKRGIIPKLISFLNRQRDEPVQHLGCIFSISCSPSCCEPLSKYSSFLISFWNRSQRSEAMQHYFISLTLANLLISSTTIPEAQVQESIQFIEAFLKECHFSRLVKAEVDGAYAWVNFGDFGRLLHSNITCVYNLGIVAFANLTGRHENRLIMEQQDVTDFLKVVCMFPRDSLSLVEERLEIIQNFEWNSPPSLEGIVKHLVEQRC